MQLTKNILLIFLILILSGCSVVVSRLVPLNDITSPTGEYSVGTEVFHWEDYTRKEWFTENPDDIREIIVQVWYPAIPQSKKTNTWIDYPSERVESISDNFKVPKFISRAIDRIDTDTYSESKPIDNDKFPIVIFSHGFEGFRTQNTTQIQELVSHGYIVFSLTHTYDALLTIFPNGKKVDRAKKYCRDCKAEQFWEVFKPQIDTRAADIHFLLDQMERIKRGDISTNFSNIMNLDKIGIFGHSFGGGTSVVVGITDSRIQSILSLDGWYTPVHPTIYHQGLNKPFLHLGQTSWDNPYNYQVLDTLFQNSKDVYYSLLLEGAQHYDFTDSPHLSNIASKFNLSSDVDSEEILDVMNTTVLGFFDQTLKSKPKEWLDKIKNNKHIKFEEKNELE